MQRSALSFVLTPERRPAPQSRGVALASATALFLLPAAAWAEVGVEGVVDTYYAYDFDRPGKGTASSLDNVRPPFLFHYTRHNEFSVNLALITAHWEADRARARVGLMGGTYAQYNYAFEQEELRHLYEVQGGIRLADDLWLDAGLFPSHLGFESAIALDNIMLTRSLSAENSPYFLAGAKLSWEPAPGLALALVVANGWQNIRETDTNTSKGGGTQLTVEIAPGTTFNWSTWVSSESPDDRVQLRVFNDIWAGLDLGALQGVLGVDVGVQGESAPGGGAAYWFVGSAIVGVPLGRAWSLSARAEYMYDDSEVIAPAAREGLFGTSLGANWEPVDDLMLRAEARAFFGAEEEFGGDGVNTALTVSLAARFGGALGAPQREEIEIELPAGEASGVSEEL